MNSINSTKMNLEVQDQQLKIKNRLPFLMLSPALIFLLIVTIPPFIYGIIVSFTKLSLLDPDTSLTYIGLDNYEVFLNDPMNKFNSIFIILGIK